MALPLFIQPVGVYERHWVVARHFNQLRSGWLMRSSVTASSPPATPTRHLYLARTRHYYLALLQCLAVNVDRAGDVQYDGLRLQFRDASFEAVTGLDSLEHVSAAQRQAFVSELSRVASSYVLLAAPFGSAERTRLEADALAADRGARG